jgi:hypothetical protein
MRFDPQGTPEQQAIIDEALARTTFPFPDCDLGRVIPVEWADLSRHRTLTGAGGAGWSALEHPGAISGYPHVHPIVGTPHSHHHDPDDPNGADPLEVRGRVLGLAYYSGKVAIDSSLEDDPEVAGEVFLSEAAHMIDFFCMEDDGRVAIWNALHALEDEDLPLATSVEDAVALDHDHSWFDVGGYYSWVGEAWMGLFVRAWSDFAVTIDFPDHPPTDEAVAAVRRWFTPELDLPQDLGVEPEPVPPVEDDVADEVDPPAKGCAPLERLRRWWRSSW